MGKVIRAGRWLDCGCCGEAFTTWPGYKDQDQDKGYGICSACQSEINEAAAKRMTDMIEVIASGLSEESRTSFQGQSRAYQENFVMNAINKGFLTWAFGPG